MIYRTTESFYKKTSDTIEFERILSNGTALKIQSGQIFLGEYALTHQKFSSVSIDEESDRRKRGTAKNLRTLPEPESVEH